MTRARHSTAHIMAHMPLRCVVCYSPHGCTSSMQMAGLASYAFCNSYPSMLAFLWPCWLSVSQLRYAPAPASSCQQGLNTSAFLLHLSQAMSSLTASGHSPCALLPLLFDHMLASYVSYCTILPSSAACSKEMLSGSLDWRPLHAALCLLRTL
jgi:hypothetical protein